MGVVIHILDRRTARLDVGGVVVEIGTLRHLSKITELDDRRVAEFERAGGLPAPVAALIAAADEHSLAASPDQVVATHTVIGWEEKRGSVTDMGWDHLPVLGHAVRDPGRDLFVLHELRDDGLHRIDRARAEALGLLADGALVRRGQPAIAGCRGVRPFAAGFAEADCRLADGRDDRILFRVDGGALPEPSWLVGRTPRDVESHAAGQGRTAGRAS